MADRTAQTYSNHLRFHPFFHFFAVPVLSLDLLYRLYLIYRTPGLAAVWEAIVALAILTGIVLARYYGLRNQDRIIRLEERVRLAALLPDDLRARIRELSTSDLIALRFYGVDEGGTTLLYIDRHLVHEVTSPQAFEGLKVARRPLWRVAANLAVADHNVPTTDRSRGIADPVSRLQVETDLRSAIHNREFAVFYQPIIALNPRRITAFEAGEILEEERHGAVVRVGRVIGGVR